MPKPSAGLLPYRITSEHVLEVFVVHPGGPFWAKKDAHAWSIVKGEHEPGEDPGAAAEREFLEEVGVPPPGGPRIDLGEVRLRSGKQIRAWAIDAPGFSPTQIVSNEFEMEWPPHSGQTRRFAEVDRSEWMPLPAARARLSMGQLEFLDRLTDALLAAGTQLAEVGES